MRVWAVALCAAAWFASPALAKGPLPAPRPASLSVPYLPQTEALCGGAAAARYAGPPATRPLEFFWVRRHQPQTPKDFKFEQFGGR